MSLGAALSIAAGGLANIDRQLALVSQNVANANTPGYAAEVGTQQALTQSGIGMGVRSGPATRLTDAALQTQTRQLTASVAELTTRQNALQAIDAVQGTPGQGNDLPSLLGALGDRFSALLNQPDSQTAQSAAVGAAATLANGINTLSDAYTAQRNAAQTNLAAEVGSANRALAEIGSLSDRIVSLKSAGQSTADVENQRDTAVDTLSGLLDIKTLTVANGDMLVLTDSGLTLPTRAADGPLTIDGGNAAPGASYGAGTLPGVMLNGHDATGQLHGGQIGANIVLRDTTLPSYQAALDEFSQTLASRFSAQGLTLFTDPNGSVPTGGGSPVQSSYVGFAAIVQVNAAVTADPSAMRDGTAAVIANPAGPSAFTPNPPGGPAGFTTLIARVLTYALGPEVQAGVPQPAPNMVGLGTTGALALPFGKPRALADFAASLVGSQAQDSAATTEQLQTDSSVHTSLTGKLTAETGVNMDHEMAAVVALQNSYGVNARVIAVAQAMWSQLLSAVAV